MKVNGLFLKIQLWRSDCKFEIGALRILLSAPQNEGGWRLIFFLIKKVRPHGVIYWLFVCLFDL